MNNEELNEGFLKAVTSGNIELAAEFLTKGADLQTLTPKGNNALYVAAMRKKRAMFDWLLKVEQKGKKLDVNHQNVNGCTIIFDAVKEGNMTYYIEELIKNQADPNIQAYDDMTPLIKAVADGKKEEIEALLKSPILNINHEIPGTKTTAFLMAVTASQGSEGLEICKLLMDNGANINAHDINGKNALINALFRTQQFMNKVEKREHQELCKFLIDQNIDLNYVAPSGMTAFWLVSMQGNRELANIMLDKGVNTDVWHSIGMEGVSSALHHWMNSFGRPEDPKNKKKEKEKVEGSSFPVNPTLPIPAVGQAPSASSDDMMMEILSESPEVEGDLEIVRKIIAGGANINAPDENGNTPTVFGFLNPLARNFIIDLGGDVNAVLHQKGPKGETVKTPVFSMIVGSGDNQQELVEKMIDLGVKTSFQDDKELKHAEAIAIAIQASAVNIVSDLLNKGGVDPNLKMKTSDNSPEITLLSLLVAGKNNSTFNKVLQQKDQIKRLLEAQEINKQNGVTSSIISEENFEELKQKYEELVHLEEQLSENRKQMFNLIIDAGADVNLENEKGYTALYYCTSPDYLDMLLDAGAKLTHTAKNDDDLLISAIKNNAGEMIPYIMKKFEEINHPTLENMYYQLAFVDAKKSHQRESIEGGIIATLSKEEQEILFTPRVDPNFVGPVIPTPKLNVQNINYVDEDGNSPLLVAAANDNPFLVALYMRLGADVNLANVNGETPLMHAIATENHRMVEFLIDNGANLNAQTNEGKKVLDFAEEAENITILEKVKIAMGKLVSEGQISGYKKLKRF